MKTFNLPVSDNVIDCREIFKCIRLALTVERNLRYAQELKERLEDKDKCIPQP